MYFQKTSDLDWKYECFGPYVKLWYDYCLYWFSQLTSFALILFSTSDYNLSDHKAIFWAENILLLFFLNIWVSQTVDFLIVNFTGL